MSLSLRKKLVLIFAVASLCLAAIGYFLYTDSTLRTSLRGPRTSDFKFLKVVGSVRSGIKALEAAELGYTFSGESAYLTACRDVSDGLLKKTSDLKTFQAESVSTSIKIRNIDSLIRQRIQYTERIISARERGGKNGAYQLIRSKGGEALSESVDLAISGLEQDTLRSSVYEDRTVEKGVRRGMSLVATGYASVLAVIFLSLFLIGREFARSRKSNRELQELKEQLHLFSDGLKDSAHFMLSREGTITSWNSGAERLQGFREQDVVGKHYSVCFSEEDGKLGKPDSCLKAAEADGCFEQIGTRQRKDGSFFQAYSLITPLPEDKGGLRGYSVVFRDVTEQKRNEELLKKLSLTVEQAADLVLITDRTGKVEYVNRAVEEVTGYSREEFFAGGLGLLQIEKLQPGKYRQIWETTLAGRTFQAEVTALGKNGANIFLDQSVTPIKDKAGMITHFVFTGSDLTPVKHMRDKIDYLATYDALTGLPNRDLFIDRLKRDIDHDTAVGRSLAVLAIDIDRFKYLNEIYGIEAGNKVLKQVAESLSVSVNKGDTVARVGSDEFAIALHNIAKPADALLFTKMIMKNVPQIVMSGGEEIAVTLAIGIAMWPQDGKDALTLIKNADTALAKAKDLGRNRYQFYTSGMNEGITELVFMERRLSDALKNKEYLLAYQPYYHLSNKKVAGAEALLRWNNQEFGFVSPAKFIPMLEETGMITDVGNWVLRTACRQIKQWGNGKSHLPVSVNISPSQFRNEYLVQTVENNVREAGIDPHRLTLEVTESVFMKDLDFAIGVLRRLKSIGVSISIDDFGTGYSSLSYLKKFPVDTVKIDQSFVRDVDTDPDTTALVSSIISMAHSLNLKTIAEGVETEEQWKILRLLRCDMGQGFYFSLAVLPQEFEKMVG